MIFIQDSFYLLTTLTITFSSFDVRNSLGEDVLKYGSLKKSAEPRCCRLFFGLTLLNAHTRRYAQTRAEVQAQHEAAGATEPNRARTFHV